MSNKKTQDEATVQALMSEAVNKAAPVMAELLYSGMNRGARTLANEVMAKISRTDLDDAKKIEEISNLIGLFLGQ